MIINFKRAVRGDLPRIVEIYNEIIPSRLATADLDPVRVIDREQWFDEFDDHHPLWVMLNKAGQIIGWVGLEPFYGRAAYGKTAEIAIYLDQNACHQGIGKQALQFVIEHLKECEITAIVAYIFGHNLPSLRLFKNFGFTQWGLLPNVAELDGVKRDLVIMGRHFETDMK